MWLIVPLPLKKIFLNLKLQDIRKTKEIDKVGLEMEVLIDKVPIFRNILAEATKQVTRVFMILLLRRNFILVYIMRKCTIVNVIKKLKFVLLVDKPDIYL